MSWYYRARAAIDDAATFLAPTQKTNLALLVSAILEKRTLRLSELARAYPTPNKRRVVAPKHRLLHRLKRLDCASRTTRGRTRPPTVQAAFVPHTVASLGSPPLLGPAIDRTMFASAGGRA